MRREAEGERKLSLFALRALEGGAAAGAEGPNSFRFVRAGQGDEARGQGVVQETARRVATRTRRDPPVALR